MLLSPPLQLQKFTSFLVVIVILSMVEASFSEGLGPVQVHNVQICGFRDSIRKFLYFAEAMETGLPEMPKSKEHPVRAAL